MESPIIPARRHCSNRSKPKSHRTAQIRHNSTHAQVPHHVIPNDSKENLVQGWLTGIETLASGSIASKQLPRPLRKSLSPASWAPNAVTLASANAVSQPSGERRHKRPRASFDDLDDSSVIVSKELADHYRVRQPRPDSATEATNHERRKKRRQRGPDPVESGSFPASSPPGHDFEKKARHKTKSDRYDVIKNDDAGKKEKRKKRTKTVAAESKKDRKKSSHLASAREVIDNFNSHSILSDRITMPPSVRPGLFENGRVSKKPITDLMFHEMSFLKETRRKTQKPLSRRRESENKRGEREREDTSALFLHKSLPDKHDLQGRNLLDGSGLSSHDGRTDDDFSVTSEHRYGSNQPRRLSDIPHRQAPIRDYTMRPMREDSQPSSYISWSISRPSAGLKEQSVSHARSPSWTPVRVREALARSGIFDKTGIASDTKHGYERPGYGVHSRNSPANARSPTVSQAPGKVPQQGSVQLVRIVRYIDRGTMADETMAEPERHAREPSMQNLPSIPQAEPSGFARPEQSVDMTSVKMPVSDTSNRQCNMTITSMELHNTHVGDQATSPDDGISGFQAAPERPKSPKWAVIERLEAAAEEVSPSYSPSATLTTAQMRRQFPHVHASNYDGTWLASEPSLTAVQWDRTPLELSASWYSNHLGTTADGSSVPYAVGFSQSQFSAVDHCLDQATSDPATAVQSKSVTALTATAQHNHDHRAQQSMQDYIAEIERHILDQTEAGEGSRVSSLKETHSLSGAEIDADVEHEGADLQSNEGLSGPSLDQESIGAALYNWAAVTELEEDEEQRFMSSFWRPNGYPN